MYRSHFGSSGNPYCATIIVVLKPFHIAQSNVGLLVVEAVDVVATL